jgi:aspartyl-tRNA(Asn)/glutamyl-tRNA(Gln) amidotransferase subunit A
MIRRQVEALMTDIDVIAMPTAGKPAPRIEGSMSIPDIMNSVFTPYWSAIGSPVISIPMGFQDGLPLSLQLAARHQDESTLLRTARSFQSRTPHHTAIPPLADPTHA